MFIVTYSVASASDEHLRKSISDALKAHESWWHYIAPIWLVVTDKSADEIAKSISPFVREGKGRLLVMEVKPREHQGLLPKDAWHWINKWAKQVDERAD